MKRITVRSSSTPLKAGKRPTTVGFGKVLTEGGERKQVYTVEANSSSFGSDFLYVFKKNVDAARIENKDTVGSRDGIKRRR